LPQIHIFSILSKEFALVLLLSSPEVLVSGEGQHSRSRDGMGLSLASVVRDMECPKNVELPSCMRLGLSMPYIEI
jgi:hypothetical protein